MNSETSPEPRRTGPRRAVAPGTDRQRTDQERPDPARTDSATASPRTVPDVPLIPTRSADDSDTGWGERSDDANDDRLLRDVPPHW